MKMTVNNENVKNESIIAGKNLKVLHTSDWHIGKYLYQYDRSAEYAALKENVIKLLSDERPDLFLLSGDIFDCSNPSVDSEKFLGRVINELHAEFPEMHVVITAGNHDSSRKVDSIGIYTSFCDHLRIIGELPVVYDPEQHSCSVDFEKIVYPVVDKDILKGIVVAFPYIPMSRLCTITMPDSVDRMNYEQCMRYVHCQALEYLKGYVKEKFNTDAENVPVICTGHCFVSSSEIRKAEEEKSMDYIGGQQAVGTGIYSGFDYAALGHIHLRQKVSHNIWYSGSPFPINFGEIDYANGVNMVTFSKKQSVSDKLSTEPVRRESFEVTVTERVFDRAVKLVRYPADAEKEGISEKEFDDVIRQLQCLPEVKPEIRPFYSFSICFDPDDTRFSSIGALREFADSTLNELQNVIRLCDMKIMVSKKGKDDSSHFNRDIHSLKDILDPLDLVTRLYRESCGDEKADLPDDMKKVLEELVEEVKTEQQNTVN